VVFFCAGVCPAARPKYVEAIVVRTCRTVAICKTCGRKYSRWDTPVSAKGVCAQCFALELENESRTDPKEHLSATRSTPSHLDDASAEPSPSPRRQSNADEQVGHSAASPMKQIHISTPKGPQTIYPEDQIRSLWQQGLLVDSALYWHESMMEWRPLREYFAPATAVAPPLGLPGPARGNLGTLASKPQGSVTERATTDASITIQRQDSSSPRPISIWQRSLHPASVAAKWASIIGMMSVFRAHDVSFLERIGLALLFSISLAILVAVPVYCMALLYYAAHGAPKRHSQ
jgi:hypothetical protein